MNNENRAYTQKVEEDFYDITSGDIEQTEDVIEYLREERNTITFGYALKRMICEKFSSGKDAGINKYICRTEDGKEFVLDDYDSDECSSEQYIELIGYLRESSGIDRLKAQNKDIKRWLDNQNINVTRDIVFRLGFILKLNALEVYELLTKGIFENGYNFRDITETVYYFCHSNNYDYAKAGELLDKFNNSDEISEAYEDKDITKQIKESVFEIADEKEFINYIISNKSKFTGHSTTVKQVFEDLLETAQELLGFYLKKREAEAKALHPDEKIRKTNPTISTLSKELNPVDNKSIKKSSIYDNVINGLITKQKITKIKKSEEKDQSAEENDKKTKTKVSRKDLIYLNFFNYTCLCSCNEDLEKSEKYGSRAQALGDFIRDYDKEIDNGNDEEAAEILKENMLTFMDETNDMLYSCNMGRMYYPNKFDNLILLSLFNREPFQYWTDIISESVENADDK